MDNKLMIDSPKRNRITSIDALRAVTLFGIIIVHSVGGFGLKYNMVHTALDKYLSYFNELFLANKCNEIFAALFGVSFYLILRNPKNSNLKFVWMSFLLVLIGLFNKLLYTQDALMWYGICGIFLVFFRNLKPKYLITISVCLLVANYLLISPNSIGTYLLGPVVGNRYGVHKSFLDVLMYPDAVVDYLRSALNGALFYTLALFIFGYWIAKIGFIENIQDRMTKRLLLTIWCIFIVSFIANYKLQRSNLYLYIFSCFSASAAYASALLYAYYHSRIFKRVLSLLEPYGKLGLTNYSMGGILGVIFINEFGLGLYKYGLTIVILFFIAFYFVQAIFSYYWLRYFTYGPMEYIWRVATERKKIPFLRRR